MRNLRIPRAPAPFRIATALVLVVVFAGCGRESARTWFDRGAQYFEKGEYAEAVAAYEAGLSLEPGSAVGHNLLGMACRMQYNTLRDPLWKEREITAFRRSVEADSTFWPAYINLGATLYWQGKPQEAAPYLRRALEIFPGNPEREQLEGFISDGERAAR